MKKLFTLLLMAFSLLANQEQVVTPTLLEFLQEMHVATDGSLPSIVKATRFWVRPKGKERWEMDDLSPENKAIVHKYASRLGLINEMSPQQKEYKYCFLLGATVFRMETRLNYLIALWNTGTRFREVVVLTGARPLDPKAETIPAGCKTETDAAHYLWMHATLPESMKGIKVTFIDVPMKVGSVRPNTGDTYVAWLDTKPAPGSCLLISNQPYCLYQKAVAETFFPQGFNLEVVGEGAVLEHQNAAVLLDTLAQTLYFNSLKLK